MWYFKTERGSYHFLWEKQSYRVGRKNTDIIISNDDSVSRYHAVVTVTKDAVTVTDKGSKYGTYIGDRKLEHNENVEIRENTVVKFGLLDSKYQLQKLKIKVALSNVKSTDKQNVYKNIEFLHGTCSQVWTESCTHLVVGEVILSVKVLCALTAEQHIVSLKYFDDFVNSVKNNEAPPKPEDYVPEIKENLLNKNIKLEFNAARKTLFKGKVFVFLTEKCRTQVADLIGITGGKAISWERTQIPHDKLKSDSTEYIFIEENFENVDENSQIYSTFCDAVRVLASMDQRSIPFPEIALAIVNGCCKENCNPRFNRVALLIPLSQPDQHSEEILAYGTADTETAASTSEMAVVSDYVLTDTTTAGTSSLGSFKRPLEEVSCVQQPKRMKEDTVADKPFELRRTSTQKAKTDKSLFTIPEDIEGIQGTSKSKTIVENPFSRKLKSTNKIPTNSKTPLENISNISQKRKSIGESSKEQLSPTEQLEKSTKKLKISELIKCTVISASHVKKMSADDDYIKTEFGEDEERLKWNESFKDKIQISVMPLVVREKNQETVSQNTTAKNFKKFKKVQPLFIQSEIIPESEMENYIVGRTCDFSYVEDEENEDQNDNFTNIGTNRPSKLAIKGRRKYIF